MPSTGLTLAARTEPGTLMSPASAPTTHDHALCPCPRAGLPKLKIEECAARQQAHIDNGKQARAVHWSYPVPWLYC